MKKNDLLKNEIKNSFSTDLLGILEDIVINENEVFVTLKASNSEEANKLDFLKKECEKKIKELFAFEKINVTFTLVKKKFKNIIAVSSCKGGVGKSTVSSNLSLAFKKIDKKVGLFDADIYGPSIPKMFGLNKRPIMNASKKIEPLKYKGIEIISIGLMIDETKPIIWRGPMIQTAIKQLINEVNWSDLDYLIIDMPPGTGDAHLTLMQKLQINHSIIVTTPQEVSLADTRKGINMFKKLGVPITGILENMSFYVCDHCNEKHYLFGKNGAETLAKEFSVEVLGKIPLIKEILHNSEEGQPLKHDKNNTIEEIFGSVALKILYLSKGIH